MTRRCTRCGELKPVEKFRRASGYADGRQRICVDCYAEAKKVWRTAGGAKKERSTPAARERQRRWKSSRAAQHPGRKTDIARMTRWRQANPESQRWIAMRYALKRRALMKAAGPIPSAEDLQALFASYGGLCVYCTATATAVDHVVALANGGSNDAANLVPACGGCNCSKSDTPLLLWLARRAA